MSSEPAILNVQTPVEVEPRDIVSINLGDDSTVGQTPLPNSDEQAGVERSDSRVGHESVGVSEVRKEFSLPYNHYVWDKENAHPTEQE